MLANHCMISAECKPDVSQHGVQCDLVCIVHNQTSVGPLPNHAQRPAVPTRSAHIVACIHMGPKKHPYGAGCAPLSMVYAGPSAALHGQEATVCRACHGSTNIRYSCMLTSVMSHDEISDSGIWCSLYVCRPRSVPAQGGTPCHEQAGSVSNP